MQASRVKAQFYTNILIETSMVIPWFAPRWRDETRTISIVTWMEVKAAAVSRLGAMPLEIRPRGTLFRREPETRHCERSEAIHIGFPRLPPKMGCFAATAPRNHETNYPPLHMQRPSLNRQRGFLYGFG